MTRCGFLASSITLAIAVVLPGGGQAQVVPGTPREAPHVAAPTPHAAAPAAPRAAAPAFHAMAPTHFSAPAAAPHPMASRLAAPHMAAPMAVPRGGSFAARPIGRPMVHELHRPGNHVTTFARTPSLGRAGIGHASLGHAALGHASLGGAAHGRYREAHGRYGEARSLTHRLDIGQSTARSHHRTVERALAAGGADRLSRQGASRDHAADKVVVTRDGLHGRFLHHDGDRDHDGHHHDWGRFAQHDRDHARHRFHHGFIGWAGPVFWPYADYDIVDYTVWPYDYGEEFWSYGSDDIVDGIFLPSTADDAAAAPPDRRSRRSRRAAPARAAAGSFAEACGAEGARGIADWPVRQIAQAVRPTDEQHAALDELQKASIEASRIIRAACPRQLPATPAGRLAVMTTRLEAMREAIDVVRPALAKFYGQLSDEQKARFNALAAPQGDADKTALARACAEQAAHVTEWPVDQVERVVRPTAGQRQSLDDLRAAVRQAADDLKASCPSELPATPPGRLDAVAKRIDALRAAVTMIRDKLEAFYSTLDDEQKARFNTIGNTAVRGES
jgi:hypothetical protein